MVEGLTDPISSFRESPREIEGFFCGMDAPGDITQLLADFQAGDPAAVDQLLPFCYRELRSVAESLMQHERPDHTLQPTALVHEAFLKLVGCDRLTVENRAHFLALAARTMRQILLDSLRRRQAVKRGSGKPVLPLQRVHAAFKNTTVDVLDLDQALNRLAELDPRQAQVVELRFFGGLTIDETARVMGLSPATVKRQWSMARAWLYRELSSKR